MQYVIVDIEATGLDRARQMIELALITYRDDKITDVFETLLNPLVPVSDFICQLTEISHRQLEEAPKFYEVADRVWMRLENSVFVSHNVEFDYPMLQEAFRLMGRELKLKKICTLKLAQELIPGLKSYTLDDLCKFFHIKSTHRHRALPDAQAALKLFLELRELAQPKARVRDLYLPQHQKVLSDIEAKAGVIYFKDQQEKIFRVLPAANMREALHQELRVRPEARDLLERTESVTWEVTGSELIARFKSARFIKNHYRFSIGLELTETGEKKFVLKPYSKKAPGLWNFPSQSKARRKLKELQAKLPRDEFAWREGGRSKQEILEHNRVVEELTRECDYPCKNLLLWGPGRTSQEWSYVLIKQGRLIGWAYHERSPEQVLANPDELFQRQAPIEFNPVAVRYLLEHRHKRAKQDQWRELKESLC